MLIGTSDPPHSRQLTLLLKVSSTFATRKLEWTTFDATWNSVVIREPLPDWSKSMKTPRQQLQLDV